MFMLQEKPPSGARFDITHSTFDKNYPKESFGISDPDNSPVESVLHYCCGVLAESRLFEFSLELAGCQFSLPINPEMCIFLEQVAGFCDFLRSTSREKAIVEFFEQGHELNVVFLKSGNNVDVRIKLKNDERLIRGELTIEMLVTCLCRFLVIFICAVGKLVPGILSEPAFLRWLSQVAFGAV